MNRAQNWLQHLAEGQPLAGLPASVQVIDAELDNRPARFIAVVPDAHNPFPRARNGEVGLLEGWGLAKAVDDAVQADREGDKRVLVALIDVPSQAYGRREEALGIHQALAGAVEAYAQARLAGHPVMRSVEALEALAAEVPPMAYDLDSYASLGLLHQRVSVTSAEAPTAQDVARVRDVLIEAVRDIGTCTDLSVRLQGQHRSAGTAPQRLARGASASTGAVAGGLR